MTGSIVVRSLASVWLFSAAVVVYSYCVRVSSVLLPTVAVVVCTVSFTASVSTIVVCSITVVFSVSMLLDEAVACSEKFVLIDFVVMCGEDVEILSYKLSVFVIGLENRENVVFSTGNIPFVVVVPFSDNRVDVVAVRVVFFIRIVV